MVRANEMIIYNFSISINSNLINVVFISFHANVSLYTSPPPLSRRCRDVDWLGIQIAQIAIIATQFSMAILSVVLIIGIHSVSIIDSLLEACGVDLWLITVSWILFEILNFFKSFNWFRLEFRIKLKSWMKLLTLMPNSPRLLCACLSVTINKLIKGKCVIGRAVHNRIPNVHVTRDCSDGKQFSSCDNATLPLVITIILFCLSNLGLLKCAEGSHL